MDTLSTLLNPGVLFFLLGFLAVLLGSNLQIPESIVRFLSLYLMLAIGFRGGLSLYESGLDGDGGIVVGIILAISAVVPVVAFFLLRKTFGDADAAAIGATYGSNSTLTYITAAGFLAAMQVDFGGYMTVALVVMETPAIILAVVLARLAKGSALKGQVGRVLRDALTDGTLLVLLGSLGIGWVIASLGSQPSPLTAFIEGDMFTGMLVFFLLYMGTVVGRRLKEVKGFPLALAAFAILCPLTNALVAILLSRWFGLGHGDAFLLTILCASASYIVAPAILKDTLPEANPARYLTMSIVISFPFNIVIGLPLFWWCVTRFV